MHRVEFDSMSVCLSFLNAECFISSVAVARDLLIHGLVYFSQ